MSAAGSAQFAATAAVARGEAPEKGYLMPAFRDVTESDAAAIWKWMEAIGKTGPKAYTP